MVARFTFLAVVALLLAACGGAGSETGRMPTATATATPSPTETPSPVATLTGVTSTPVADVCAEGDAEYTQGVSSADSTGGPVAYTTGSLRMAQHEHCTRLVLDFFTGDSGELEPVATPPGFRVDSLSSETGGIRLHFDADFSVTAEVAEVTGGDVVAQAFIVRDEDGSAFLDVHTTADPAWRVFTLENPGRIVLDVVAAEPLRHPVPLYAGKTVVLNPVDGADVGHTFTITGYARNFEANIIVERQRADGTWELVGGPGVTNDWTQMYGLFSVEVTLEAGTHRLRVGDVPPSGEEPFEGPEFEVNVS